MYVNHDGGDGDSFLYFYENSSATGAYLKWDDTGDRFEMNDSLYVSHDLIAGNDIYLNFDHSNSHANIYFGKPTSGNESLTYNKTLGYFVMSDALNIQGSAYINGHAYVNFNGPDAASYFYFYEDSNPEGAFFGWNDTDSTFVASHNLHVNGTIQTTTSGSWLKDTAIGGDLQVAHNINAASVESEGHIFLNRSGPDRDIYLYFYEGGSYVGAYLMWDDHPGLFKFNQPLLVEGATQISGSLFVEGNIHTNANEIRLNYDNSPAGATTSLYMRQNAWLKWADATGFHLSHTLYIEDGLAVYNNIYVNQDGPDGDSSLYFYENSSATGAYLRWDDDPGNFAMNKGLKVGDGGTTNYTEIKADGEINLHGTARVTQDLWLNVTALKAPGTKPATLVDYGMGDAWEFTDGVDDTVVSRIKLPEDMDMSAGVNILIGWNTPTSNAGNCKWDVEYLFRQEDEAMDAAADATLTATVAASATAKGLLVSSIGTTVVPHADDICMTIRVKRRADEAADTLGEDNHLFGVCFLYTSNKIGTAL